jgi:hypothetical protein
MQVKLQAQFVARDTDDEADRGYDSQATVGFVSNCSKTAFFVQKHSKSSTGVPSPRFDWTELNFANLSAELKKQKRLDL